MTDEANQALLRLDERIADLRQALKDSDWDRVAELNHDVRSLVEPVMTALENSQLPLESVQQRLGDLDAFVREADAAARQVRQEAQEALEQVGQNRKAANAYARVSNRSR